MPDALTAFAPPPPPAIQQQGQQQGPPVSPAVQNPAPTHAQTVAALRHFRAVIGELTGLAKNPDLGKTSVKSSIINGTTKLVSERMMLPGQAVDLLSSVPERPFDQKVWVVRHLQNALLARNAVLAHHQQAFAGQGELPSGDPDDHMEDMSSLVQSHYGGGRA